MTIAPYAPISSYAEITVPTVPGDFQHQQGILLLRQLIAAGLVETNQYMLYRQEDQHEIRIAADPFATVTVTANTVSLQRTDGEATWQEPLSSNPLKQVENLLARIAIPDATAYGYVAFELARCYLSSASLEDLSTPLLSFFIPRLELHLLPEMIRIRSLDIDLLERCLDIIMGSAWRQIGKIATPEQFPVLEQDASWYMEGVQTITDAIHLDASVSGPFQKAILSRAVTVSEEGDLDLLETYRVAEQGNAFARSYCLSLGTEAAVGCSPETLLEADATGMVSTNPLAGTRWRGKTPEEDAKLATMLDSSHKQRTEHLLSVLEAQRELEKVCTSGSVTVRGLAHIQKYRTVQHLASRLSGMLAPPYTVWDALRVLFPGVTVSGIAKAVALQWIMRLEPEPRGLYAGATGWISSNGAADLAITIRTLFQSGKQVRFQAGAGIVADSDPRDEYEETWHKMQTMWPYMVRSKRPEGDVYEE